MNQTKKRLSIIELAISITDIETIKLQVLQLNPLRSDDAINDILSLLDTENYAQAQTLITDYIDNVHEAVIQRVPEDEVPKITEDQATIETYDFLVEKNDEAEVVIEKTETEKVTQTIVTETKLEDKKARERVEVTEETNDFSSLLELDANEILSDNIQITISDKSRENKVRKKIDFNLDTIPKDSFFDNTTLQEETIKDTKENHEESIAEIVIMDKNIKGEEDFFKNSNTPKEEVIVETIKKERRKENSESKNIPYFAIPNIYNIFQNIQVKYPAVEHTERYSDILEVWLEKIADEGYTESEVEEVLNHIETLATTDKAQAAQFLLVTSRTESKYAKFILARALYRGSLLIRDLDESFKIMTYLAFEEKYPEAICDLAQFYENGISVDKDKKLAETLYKDAMEEGIQRARTHYERLHNENKGFFSFLKG